MAFMTCVDGLKDFPDAINSIYPYIHIPLYIISIARNCQKYVIGETARLSPTGFRLRQPS
ncbi:Hypothetical protein ETEE_1270 [Edwardsiella anguillarum ET080813]|uniref:Uncharacterized protein n=1 Tax=Edwardsiella anguillarum ET080813 TaxID=667120 RepID=A0A076LLW4_9GAMM|nr:Hypothetical protein ETEE_1270 [Edwardsiella anguillarum ET080813]